jgi:hypothetical protein
VAGRFGTLSVRAGGLASFRAAVIACAAEEDRDACERLLGQLASLEGHYADTDAELSFNPPPGARDLAERALAELHARPPRRRPAPRLVG